MFKRKINSFGVHGVEGFPVTVEADVSDGPPGCDMAGFPKREQSVAQERVRTVSKCGDSSAEKVLMVNLSPGI